MKPSFIIALLLAQPFMAVAEQPVPKMLRPVLSSQAPRAWLGLRVAKPDETITAHVPSLPQGVGFVVNSLDTGGPAEAAGLRELDLLWKFGDQMLINEAQLATLLRLSNPGEEVVISGFRGGKPLEVKLKLGEAPAPVSPIRGDFVEAAVLPDACTGPMRVVKVFEKTASFSDDEGTATVHRDGDTYQIRIQNPKSELIYEGDLTKDGGLNQIPETWRRRIQGLCRSLDKAIEGNVSSEREPRPRVVPPPLQSR